MSHDRLSMSSTGSSSSPPSSAGTTPCTPSGHFMPQTKKNRFEFFADAEQAAAGNIFRHRTDLAAFGTLPRHLQVSMQYSRFIFLNVICFSSFHYFCRGGYGMFFFKKLLFVCKQLHVITTDWIFVEILQRIYLVTGEVWLNFGRYLHLDPDLGIFWRILQHCEMEHFATVWLIALGKLTGSYVKILSQVYHWSRAQHGGQNHLPRPPRPVTGPCPAPVLFTPVPAPTPK